MTLETLIQRTIAFRDARNWKQFHTPKDVALSLVLEAAEVMEHFQWKTQDEIDEYLKINKKEVGEELADVLSYLIIMSHDLNIDLLDSLNKKLNKNEGKYPVEKSRDNHTKYNKL